MNIAVAIIVISGIFIQLNTYTSDSGKTQECPHILYQAAYTTLLERIESFNSIAMHLGNNQYISQRGKLVRDIAASKESGMISEEELKNLKDTLGEF